MNGIAIEKFYCKILHTTFIHFSVMGCEQYTHSIYTQLLSKLQIAGDDSWTVSLTSSRNIPLVLFITELYHLIHSSESLNISHKLAG